MWTFGLLRDAVRRVTTVCRFIGPARWHHRYHNHECMRYPPPEDIPPEIIRENWH